MSEGAEIWRITGGEFTALLQFSNRGHVWWAAPAIKQMERWPRKRVVEYCQHKGWKMEREVRGEYWPFSARWEEVRPDKPE